MLFCISLESYSMSHSIPFFLRVILFYKLNHIICIQNSNASAVLAPMPTDSFNKSQAEDLTENSEV